MTSAEPEVSVVIAVRDGAAFIGRTLASARAQTLTDIEIVVVDDGSQDDTAALVTAVAAEDPRVRLVSIEPTGVAGARNLAVEEARSDLVAVLDGDDLWCADKLEVQVAALRAARPGTAAVGCLAVTIDLDDQLVTGLPPFGPRVLDDLDGWALLPFILSHNLWCGSLPLFTRREFLEVGGYDPSWRTSEDYEMAARLAERHPFAVVPRFLVGYRQHPVSRSSDARSNLENERAILDQVAARNPWIPARVFRWSRASRHVFAAARSLNRGDARGAVRHAVQAVACDPAVLLQPDAVSAALAVVTRRSSLRTATPLRFPEGLDEFLAREPASTYPGQSRVEQQVERLEWRRHRRLGRIERDHHALHPDLGPVVRPGGSRAR